MQQAKWVANGTPRPPCSQTFANAFDGLPFAKLECFEVFRRVPKTVGSVVPEAGAPGVCWRAGSSAGAPQRERRSSETGEASRYFTPQARQGTRFCTSFRVAVGPLVGPFRFGHGARRFGTRETSRYVESRAGAKIQMKTPRPFRGRPAVPATAPGVLARPPRAGTRRRVLGRPVRDGTLRRVLGRPGACWDAQERAGTPEPPSPTQMHG